ncbi:hypothetical protein INR49_005487 [Caranx melampygus]|nr:hypothetical protein INR49_005487 [Caranx melampygus]
MAQRVSGRARREGSQMGPWVTFWTAIHMFTHINCVTFPLPGEGPEQQLLKPNEWSYCDYFWVSNAPTLKH